MAYDDYGFPLASVPGSGTAFTTPRDLDYAGFGIRRLGGLSLNPETPVASITSETLQAGYGLFVQVGVAGGAVISQINSLRDGNVVLYVQNVSGDPLTIAHGAGIFLSDGESATLGLGRTIQLLRGSDGRWNEVGKAASRVLVQDGDTITSLLTAVQTGLSERALSFDARSDLVTWAASEAPVDGVTAIAGGDAYRFDGGNTISDLDGWSPVGVPNPHHWGAAGDGAADDTAPLQSMLNFGQRGELRPGATYRVTGQVTIGSNAYRLQGQGAKIVADDMATAINVISAVGRSDLWIEGVHVVPTCTTRQSLYANFGISLTNCVRATVIGCEISGHRQGIQLHGCSDSAVTLCKIHDSTVTASDLHSQTGSDIALHAECKECRVTNNSISFSAGVGIKVQDTATSGEVIENIVISGNIIEEAPQYGILAYRIDEVPRDTINGLTISGNLIDTVHGNIRQDPGLERVWGAGIYVQGARRVSVAGNTVRRTNLQTDTEIVGIAGITLTNSRQAAIAGNYVHDCAWYGIAIAEPNQQGDAGTGAAVSGNVIEGCGRDGIYVKGFPTSSITGNEVSGCRRGIYAIAGGAVENEEIAVGSNVIRGCSNAGIRIDSATVSSVTGNVVSKCLAGIGVAAGRSSVTGNAVYDCPTSHGFDVRVGAGAVMLSGNVSQGNNWNFTLNAPAHFDQSNCSAAPVTADFAGTFAPGRVLAVNSTTPSVQLGRYFKATNTAATTIADFLDPAEGQIVTIQATNGNTTVANNLGINLAGSAAFAMGSGDTLTLISIGGTWVEIGRMER